MAPASLEAAELESGGVQGGRRQHRTHSAHSACPGLPARPSTPAPKQVDMFYTTVMSLETALAQDTDPEEEASHRGQERC